MLDAFIERLPSLLLSLPIILLALSAHETAHGYVAYKLGDPTAHNLGRLTLNPLKHLDPIGFLCMVFFRFGWAKPVPVNTRNLRNPRRDMALVGIAGPVSNLLLALISTVILRIYVLYLESPFFFAPSQAWYTVADLILIFLGLSVMLNLSLAVFNMLPIPPFDGSRFCYIFLPEKIYFGIMQYERYIYMGLMLLLFLGVLDTPLSLAVGWLFRLMGRLVDMPDWVIHIFA